MNNLSAAEIRVSGFDLIISIEYLLKISQYFTIPESETAKFSEPKPIESSIKQSSVTHQSPKSNRFYTFKCLVIMNFVFN